MRDLLNPPGGQPRIDFWPPFLLFGDNDALTLVPPDGGQWIGRAGKDELEEAPLILACTERTDGVGYVFRVIRSDGERIGVFDSLRQLTKTVTGASMAHDRLIVDTIDHLIDHLAGTTVKVEAETAPVHAIADDNPVGPLIASAGVLAAAANMMADITRRAPTAELKGVFLPVKMPSALGNRVDDMYRAAAAVRDNAHAPYSNYKVAAAILDDGGTIHTGVNVENAAYPQGQCAESSAIGAMVTAGRRRIAAVLVLGGSPNDCALCTPCGGCRQRIREFAAPDTPVYVCGPEGIRRILTLDDLLPLSFGPTNLTF